MSEHVLVLRGATPEAATRNTPRVAKAASSARWKRPESWEYRLLFGATFMVFLFAACIELLDPRRYVARKDASNANQLTIIQRASLGARTCVAYAFMG